MDSRELKILRIGLKNKGVLLIPSTNIAYIEMLTEKTCRVHFDGKYIDVDKDIDWFRKHFERGIDESTCYQV